MKYANVGKSGLKVSRIILGQMSYGSPEWSDWVLGEEEGIKHIKFAYEHGITTFDTADAYSNGQSEIILGKALKQLNIPRDNVVVMTKVFFARARDSMSPGLMFNTREQKDQLGYSNGFGLSRKHIFEAIKGSLERLQLDYVDVLQCHRFDPLTPIAETMQALHDVVQAGYVRYIGMSSCYAYQFQAMQNYAIANRLTPFISMQNHYNLVYREEEREMMPTLKMMGVGSLPWSPLARGLLARPLGVKNTTRSESDWMINDYIQYDSDKLIMQRLEDIAKAKGRSMAQIALAWILSKDPVAAPVIGTTSLKNLEDLIGAMDVELTAEEIKLLDEPYKGRDVQGALDWN